MNYSPIPWNISKHATPEHSPQFGLYSGSGHNPDIVIVTGPNAKADAEFIKRAVDNHEALVDILNEICARVISNDRGSFEISPSYIRAAKEVVLEARHG
jgi:hypothetical protein